MNAKQQTEAQYVTDGRPDVKFERFESGDKVILQGTGKKLWPEIRIGKRGGVEIGIKSYDTRIKSAREWALLADDLLEKQSKREAWKAGIREIGPPTLDNVKFFACAYLNDWWQYDSTFVNGLRTTNDAEVRRYWLVEAASYYQVGRNLAEEHERGLRLSEALAALDKIVGPIIDDEVNTKVDALVTLLKATYKNTLTSAASKFLWLIHQSPVVIYDSRARTCLVSLTGREIPEHDYVDYRQKWRDQFDLRQKEIASACADLLGLSGFAPSQSDEEDLESVASSAWFHERVFDKFLWWNGRSEEAPG
jgi:hypothetical protein